MCAGTDSTLPDSFLPAASVRRYKLAPGRRLRSSMKRARRGMPPAAYCSAIAFISESTARRICVCRISVVFCATVPIRKAEKIPKTAR
jgi:hypothetical protein